MRNPSVKGRPYASAGGARRRNSGGGRADPDALLREAVQLARQGRAEDAAQRCRAILQSNPHHFEALQMLGVLQANRGRLGEAVALLRRACAREPPSAPAHNNLGLTLNLIGRHEEAAAVLERAVALDPSNPMAHNNLGVALQGLGRPSHAARCFQKALELKPDYVEAMSNLGALLHAQRRAAEALAPLEHALALAPAFVSALGNYSAALHRLERGDEARACLDRALALAPGDPQLLAQAAAWHAEAGRFEDARRCYERALAARPADANLLNALVNLGRVGAHDRALATLRELAASEAELPDAQRIPLHFGLAKALADLGEHERSFEHLLRGNAIKRRYVEYDEGILDTFERIRTVFSAELLARRAGAGNPSAQPIFIVGMMRSGTTLIEQVLASHPEVYAGGERGDFSDAYAAARLTSDPALRYPESIAHFTDEELRRVGDGYLARIGAVPGVRARGGALQRVTDKMPGNFSAVGLIRLALPGARIIHAVRDPVDTCLSCFSKLFSDDQPHTYDLAELGRYYRAYERLMDHWRAVLPAGAMLEVRYEDVVADFETQARRLIEYCGLPWDDACLRFFEAPRAVTTASQVQVRQPIYRTSVGRWRPGGDALRPLLAALGTADGN